MNTIVYWDIPELEENLFLNIYDHNDNYIKFIDLIDGDSHIPKISAKLYDKCIAIQNGVVLHYTTASTFEEAKQQYPELFI